MPWNRTDVGIVRRDGLAAGAVALGADLDHPRAGGQAGAGDRQVGELGGDGEQVIAPRAVALLATDRGVGRLGPRRREHRPGVGDVAWEAAADRVVGQGQPQETPGFEGWRGCPVVTSQTDGSPSR